MLAEYAVFETNAEFVAWQKSSPDCRVTRIQPLPVLTCTETIAATSYMGEVKSRTHDYGIFVTYVRAEPAQQTCEVEE